MLISLNLLVEYTGCIRARAMHAEANKPRVRSLDLLTMIFFFLFCCVYVDEHIIHI